MTRKIILILLKVIVIVLGALWIASEMSTDIEMKGL